VVAGKPDKAPAPEVPARVRLMLAGNLVKRDGREEVAQRQLLQAQGYQGVVVNGLKTLSPAARQRLRERAPDTDPDEVILLDDRAEPVSAQLVEVYLWGGGLAVAIGLLVAAGAYSVSSRTPVARLLPVPAGSLCRAN
jgi:hypothetical protein